MVAFTGAFVREELVAREVDLHAAGQTVPVGHDPRPTALSIASSISAASGEEPILAASQLSIQSSAST